MTRSPFLTVPDLTLHPVSADPTALGARGEPVVEQPAAVTAAINRFLEESA